MSEPKLNHLRRNELVQVLRDMMLSANKNPVDVETWVSRVFMAATQPPQAAIHAAEALERWNCFDNSPSGYQGGVRFTPPENGYETIAEIVLAAAYEFDESNVVCKEDPPRPQTLVYVPRSFDDLIHRVIKARTFIENTFGSNAATEQMNSLNLVVDELVTLRDNYLLVPKNE